MLPTIKAVAASTSINRDTYVTTHILSCQCSIDIFLSCCYFSQNARHPGEEINTYQAYALAHKGKATADIHFNPNDPPEAYSNPSIHSRLTSYSDMAKQVHGPEHDPSAHDLDGEVVMRVGGGKKHGRYYLGDSVIDTASTPTLSQIRARSTGSDPGILPRPSQSYSSVQVISVTFIP